MAISKLNEPGISRPQEPQTITAPNVNTSGSSVSIADAVNQGVKNAFGYMKDFNNMAIAAAEKRNKIETANLKDAYELSVAETLNDMQYGGKEFKNESEIGSFVKEKFNARIQDKYNPVFVAKWLNSQDGLNTTGIGNIKLNAERLGQEYKYQSKWAAERGKEAATIAWTTGNKQPIDNLKNYLRENTVLTDGDIEIIYASSVENFEMGRLEQDIINQPEKALSNLKNPEYLPHINTVRRVNAMQRAENRSEALRASGRKENAVYDWAIDNRENFSQVQNYLYLMENNKDFFDAIYDKNFIESYGDTPEGRRKAFKDVLTAQKNINDLGTVEAMDNYNNVSGALFELNDIILNSANKKIDDASQKAKPTDILTPESKVNFQNDMQNFDNAKKLIQSHAYLTQNNTSGAARIMGADKYRNNTVLINNAMDTFYGDLSNEDSAVYKEFKKTAGGQAAINFVNFVSRRNTDKTPKQKLYSAFSSYIDGIYKEAEIRGIDLSKKSLPMSVSTELNNIVIDYFGRFFRDEMGNLPNEPKGKVDLKQRYLIGGDMSLQGLLKAGNNMDWSGNAK